MHSDRDTAAFLDLTGGPLQQASVTGAEWGVNKLAPRLLSLSLFTAFFNHSKRRARQTSRLKHNTTVIPVRTRIRTVLIKHGGSLTLLSHTYIYIYRGESKRSGVRRLIHNLNN